MEYIYQVCSMNSLRQSYSERGVTASFTELAEGCPEETTQLHVIINAVIVRGRQQDLVCPCI